MIATVRRARGLNGEVKLPGDKSISHRALMFGAIASGTSRVRGLLVGADVRSTARCLRDLGVGNSGTTMRLMAGLLGAQEFESILTGDESLGRRPMDRVVEPLTRMGAKASWPPLRVGGQGPLRGIEYVAPVASAQVKSAVLLAGLFAEGETTVIEPVPTRDHTERMLRAMGVQVRSANGAVSIAPPAGLSPLDIQIPGDMSAASFWLVAGGLVNGSRLRMPHIGVNPSRTAFLELLKRAGFAITVRSEGEVAGEPVGSVEIAGVTRPRPVTVDRETAAAVIDELPALAVAATQLPGRSRITGAGELRVKESDRIAAMAEGLSAMGADITALDDGWEIQGPTRLEGARVRSHGDHRVAMALAVAGLIAEGGPTDIDGAECVDISYPGFFEQLEAL